MILCSKLHIKNATNFDSMSLGNTLTKFLFSIGASVVLVLGRGELLSDDGMYARFLNSPPKSRIGDYDSKANQHEKEQTPVGLDVKYRIESITKINGSDHDRHAKRRWVVERTNSWHNKLRKLLVR